MASAFRDEFKAIRDEILATYSRRTTIQSVGTSLFAGLQSAALLAKTPELSIVGTFLMIAFWNDDVRWLSAIAKMGAYIRNVIEPRVYGLQWERVLMVVDERHRDNSNWSSRVSYVVSRYPMTTLIGIVLGIIMLMTLPDLSPLRILLAAVALVGASVLFVQTHLNSTNWAAVHAGWNTRFRNAKEAIEKVIGEPGNERNADGQ